MISNRLSHRISIKWKIFLYLIGFCLLLLLILGLFQILLLDLFYKGIKIRDIQQETGLVAQYIGEGDWDTLTTLVNQRGDLYVEVWSPAYDTILVTGNIADGVQSQLGLQEKATLYLEAEDTGGHVLRRYVQESARGRSQESILYGQLLDLGGDRVGLLMVSANISPINATVDTLRTQLCYIAAMMMLLAGMIALAISRRVSRPIERLNTAAKELAKGNYEVDFCRKGYREITELAGTLDTAAKELAKTERLRQELIANVSHDLRTPLTLITGYAEMMQELPDENTPENLQVIAGECKRLTSLVNDLMDLSKLQSGAQKLELSTFCITEELADIIDRFSRLSGAGCDISFVSDQAAYVKADPVRINQVVYNFLINAVTHTGDDRQVVVRQEVERGRVTVMVEDTGEGISAEDLPYIWDRYYKVDKVHKRSTTGSGLGLSIVKAILEQHPGVEYGARSQPGEGSVFWFSLPLTAPPPQEGGAPEQPGGQG